MEFYRRALKLSKEEYISSKTEALYFMGNTFIENSRMEEHFYVDLNFLHY